MAKAHMLRQLNESIMHDRFPILPKGERMLVLIVDGAGVLLDGLRPRLVCQPPRHRDDRFILGLAKP